MQLLGAPRRQDPNTAPSSGRRDPFRLTIEQPETWAALSLVMSVVFIPMYVVARRADS